MQGSQEGKRAKLWGPRAHFGANISMKIAMWYLTETSFPSSPLPTTERVNFVLRPHPFSYRTPPPLPPLKV